MEGAREEAGRILAGAGGGCPGLKFRRPASCVRGRSEVGGDEGPPAGSGGSVEEAVPCACDAPLWLSQ